jgi:phage terminase Nu1 subunit (DNA packaging protein)
MTAVSKSGFAKILGVSRAMVGKYCKAGLPQRSDGMLDLERARGWVAGNVDRDAYLARRNQAPKHDSAQRAKSARAPLPDPPLPRSLTDERARLAAAMADKAELNVARLRGELLPASEVVLAWSSAIGRARSLLLGVPIAAANVAVMIVRREPDDVRAAAAVRKHLADEIHAALEELANTDLDNNDDEDEEQSTA